jgi:hypothetical protein
MKIVSKIISAFDLVEFLENKTHEYIEQNSKRSTEITLLPSLLRFLIDDNYKNNNTSEVMFFKNNISNIQLNIAIKYDANFVETLYSLDLNLNICACYSSSHGNIDNHFLIKIIELINQVAIDFRNQLLVVDYDQAKQNALDMMFERLVEHS